MRRSWRRLDGGDGVSVATETTRWGLPPRPRVVAAHATGFCKEVLRPFVTELTSLMPSGEVAAFDHRGHGGSDPPLSSVDWWDIGRDVLTVAADRRSVEASTVVGVGHSAGAAGILLAELLAPGTFAAMVLVEPIVFPGPYGRVEDLPLVDAALKRKTMFESREAARENFVDKTTFANWDPRALEEYLRHGLRPTPEGYTLACAPDIEAEYYRSAGAHRGWDRLGEVTVPVTLVAGDLSDTHDAALLSAMASELGSADVVIEVVPGASHFVMMERPVTIAAHTVHRLPPGYGEAAARR